MILEAGHFVLSAEGSDGAIWIVRTDDRPTAEHVADLFRLSDHVRVTITSPDAPLDID